MEGNQATTGGRWVRRETPYQRWQEAEQIPIYRGSFVTDLQTLELGPWARTEQQGAFVNLADQEEDDSYVLEIAPGGQTAVQHHLFEAMFLVLSGRGATTLWQEGTRKQTVEWQRGSLFAPPINCYYQHFNLDGQQPARLYACTRAPAFLNLIRNADFVFNTPYTFRDRFDLDDDNFVGPGEHTGRTRWRTNFVPNVHTFELDPYPERGAGGVNMHFTMCNEGIRSHISEFPIGTYKKAHRHGAGAHVLILGGEGYSLLWMRGEPIGKVDWVEGTVLSPQDLEYHQHFNTGSTPARYLAFTLGLRGRRRAIPSEDGEEQSSGTVSEREGGSQIEYADQNPRVHEMFLEALARSGVKCRMELPR